MEHVPDAQMFGQLVEELAVLVEHLKHGCLWRIGHVHPPISDRLSMPLPAGLN